MTDLGNLQHYLSIAVTRSSDGLLLSQSQYVVDLSQHAGMAECHSTMTPLTLTPSSLLQIVLLWLIRPSTWVLLVLSNTLP